MPGPWDTIAFMFILCFPHLPLIHDHFEPTLWPKYKSAQVFGSEDQSGELNHLRCADVLDHFIGYLEVERGELVGYGVG